MIIDQFAGRYRFLSNFYPATVRYDGVLYPSSEHAYQAAKTLDKTARSVFMSGSPGSAKRNGRKVRMRPDWEQLRIDVMRGIVLNKFQSHPPLAAMLLDTGDATLIEGNHWGDRFWGCVWMDGKWAGENHLGRILMEVRESVKT